MHDKHPAACDTTIRKDTELEQILDLTASVRSRACLACNTTSTMELANANVHEINKQTIIPY
jgi:hypothetical protein